MIRYLLKFIFLLLTLSTLFINISAAESIQGTWQINNFPQPGTGEYIFQNNGTFSSVLYNEEINLNAGIYTFFNNILTLNYLYSTKPDLINTIKKFENVSLSETNLKLSSGTFIKMEYDKTSIISSWQISGFPQDGTRELVLNKDDSFTSVSNETDIILSSGTYTYINNTITLNNNFSTKTENENTIETVNVTGISESEFKTLEKTFLRIITEQSENIEPDTESGSSSSGGGCFINQVKDFYINLF